MDITLAEKKSSRVSTEKKSFMDVTEKKSIMGRIANAMRTNSLRRKKSTNSEKEDESTKRIDSGLTNLSNTTSTSQESKEKTNTVKDSNIFQSRPKATTLSNRIQKQSLVDGPFKITRNEVVADTKTEYFDPNNEPAAAATEFAANTMEDIFSRDPSLTIENSEDVTTTTIITKSIETKPNARASKPPVEIQIKTVETKVHVESKTEVKDFAKTLVVTTTEEKPEHEEVEDLLTKKEEKLVLGPVKATWELKLTPKNSDDRTKRPMNFHINFHHKGAELPGNLPAGISSPGGSSSPPPSNLKPSRR
jgi:hypothetical protein